MKSKIIVITGSISTGKSTITNYLKELNYPVLDADKIAHELMEIGNINYNKILENFGSQILDDKKNIDRKKLSAIVFSDKEKLTLLNNLTHINIFNKLKYESEKINGKIIFLDIPLYIETLELNKKILDIDEIWLVYAKKDIQLKRLMDRNNIAKEEALKLINSQMDIEEKIKYADFVIDNSHFIEESQKQIDAKLEIL